MANRKSLWLSKIPYLLLVLSLAGCTWPWDHSGQETPALLSQTTPGSRPDQVTLEGQAMLSTQIAVAAQTLMAAQIPSATPSPEPTSTPPPDTVVQNGDIAFFQGDYDLALTDYQAILDGSASEDIHIAALYGLGRTYVALGQDNVALETLRRFLDQYPASPFVAGANFLLGNVYIDLKRYSDAAQAYQQYVTLKPGLLDAYMQERAGDAFRLAGDYAQAQTAYQAALDAPHLGSNEAVMIKIARSFAESGDFPNAIQRYQDIYAQTTSDYTKAQMDLLIGQAEIAFSEQEKAFPYFQDAVKSFPRSLDSYSALVALVNAGVVVDDLDRGLVDYFAGQYPPAVQAFDRYLANNPPDAGAANTGTPDAGATNSGAANTGAANSGAAIDGASQDGTAHFYKALALRNIGESNYPPGSLARETALLSGPIAEDQEAIAEFQALIKDYPSDRFWSDAWDEIAYTQWVDLEKPDLSAQTMLDFVARFPDHARAAEFLFYAGRYFERANSLDDAAHTWESLADKYPSSEYTLQSLILGGVSRYRLGQFNPAQLTFQRALVLSTQPQEKAAAYLWVGKALAAQNDPAGAQAAWQQAQIQDPTGYYSERARDLVLNRMPFTLPPIVDLAVDMPTERAEAETWMRATFNLLPETDLSSPTTLSDDGRLKRGLELWSLGQFTDARVEFENLRQEIINDPLNTYRFMNVMLEQGLYREAILSSRQVLTLAGMNDASSLNAPAYFNHIRFGTYYKDLVLTAAHSEDISSLVLFSLIRQESLFDGHIQSSAGADGLMQLMPATAAEVAGNLGWPADYSTRDLFRPFVNVRMGTHYLAQQTHMLEGDLYAALSAYNGGPGNALAWKELAPNDPDLFLEVVRPQETRDYIMRIYENFCIYRRFYGRGS